MEEMTDTRQPLSNIEDISEVPPALITSDQKESSMQELQR
jgi:hypothetical protein